MKLTPAFSTGFTLDIGRHSEQDKSLVQEDKNEMEH
jgi:hypothetical protein